ncbi:MAG: hypothetical protein JOY82_10515 [Streptosporangiaceae bacterium]|nr:hypothetical protein [Streptosporangiaceae bacterium]MBV9854939.1 hypothetical protein [Streptosporangiaceae bacterium]
MKMGTGLALVAVGAILAFAVTTNTWWLNLHVAGWVLMIVGIIGLAIPRSSYGWLGRRLLVRRVRTARGHRVEEYNVPHYVPPDPGEPRVRAGLPPGSSVYTENSPSPDTRINGRTIRGQTVPGDVDEPVPTAPVSGDTEVIEEDVYEE